MRFKQSLNLLQTYWPKTRLESHPLQDHPDLSIDWMWADAHKKENLVILSTGEHGVEGYVGAAMLKIFIEEISPQLNPENTGLLLVHAINPWGMQHFERYNANHVDLNRNFIPDDKYDKSFNPGYAQLANLICPQRRINSVIGETLRFAGNLITALVNHGATFIREGTLMGQYHNKQGVYFGGHGREEETDVIMALLKKAFKGYKTIIHMDMHTGYGPRYQMSLVNSPLEPES